MFESYHFWKAKNLSIPKIPVPSLISIFMNAEIKVKDDQILQNFSLKGVSNSLTLKQHEKSSSQNFYTIHLVIICTYVIIRF